jgi:transcriptional regulator with XRE-family HTH domain
VTNDYKEQKFLDRLATRIADLRKEKGYTQERLAAEAGIDRVALANIETRRRRPTVTTIYRLARAMDLHIQQFFDFYH